ncbi:MAG: hypothetical protein RI959_133 [Pseudomonadota bacterium]
MAVFCEGWRLNLDARDATQMVRRMAPQVWRALGVGGVFFCAGLAQAATLQVTVVDGQGQPVPHAVVFLESPEAAKAVKPMGVAEMAQKNKAFVPDVMVVTKGTAVSFPNQDTVRHHVYSFSPVKRFEIKLYVGTPATPVVFDQTGVAVLGCNIHDDMVAWMLVVDTPYHAIAGPDGLVKLPDAPAGSYRLRTWSSRLPVGAPAQSQNMRLAGEDTAVKVALKDLVAP